MSQQESFLAEVIANPDDDAPRLIYADWLDERGDDSRSEFIRVQCQLEKTDDLDPNYFDLVHRNELLLSENASRWARELGLKRRGIGFSRGFAETLTTHAHAFIRDGAELLKKAPFQSFRFSHLGKYTTDLAKCPALEGVRQLSFGSMSQINDEQLIAILNSPNLTNLRTLDLGDVSFLSEKIGQAMSYMPSHNSLEELHLYGLASSSFLTGFQSGDAYPRLKHLTIQYPREDIFFLECHFPALTSILVLGNTSTQIGSGLENLPWAQLKQIRLGLARLSLPQFQALSEKGAFQFVEDLSLELRFDSDMDKLNVLFSNTNLEHCKSLTFPHNYTIYDVPDQLISALVSHTPLCQLERLTLPQLDLRGWDQLATSELKVGLKSLSAVNAELSTGTAWTIRNSSLRHSLRRLKLPNFKIPKSAMVELCKDEFPNMIELSLSRLPLSNDPFEMEEEIVHLIQSGAFSNLRSLSLDDLTLTDETLKAIAQADFPELREISFEENNATDEAIQKMLGNLPKLRHLSIVNTKGLKNRPKISAATEVSIKY